MFTRAIQYGLENYPEKGEEEQWKRFAAHMEEKYSINGYIKLWIPGSPNAKRLRTIQNIIEDKDKLHEIFNRIYKQIK